MEYQVGQLTILDEFKEGGCKKVLAKCSCGKIKTYRKSNVKVGGTISCGCYKRKLLQKPQGESGFSEAYKTYKSSAKKRNKEFALTKEQFRDIATRPCTYCGSCLENKMYCYQSRSEEMKQRSEWRYTGIDRKDNELGYTVENSIPCCGICNRGKYMLTEEQWEKYIMNLVEFRLAISTND